MSDDNKIHPHRVAVPRAQRAASVGARRQSPPAPIVDQMNFKGGEAAPNALQRIDIAADLSERLSGNVEVAPGPDWPSMTDDALHAHAKAEQALRADHEAGNLPPDIILPNGYRVSGVDFTHYKGAGKAWEERIYGGMLLRGAPSGPIYFLTPQDRTRIIDHIRAHAADYMLEELGREIAYYKKRDYFSDEKHPEKINTLARWLGNPQNRELINDFYGKVFENAFPLEGHTEQFTMEYWVYCAGCYLGGSHSRDLTDHAPHNTIPKSVYYHGGGYFDPYRKSMGEKCFTERSFAPLTERIEQEATELKSRMGGQGFGKV